MEGEKHYNLPKLTLSMANFPKNQSLVESDPPDFLIK